MQSKSVLSMWSSGYQASIVEYYYCMVSLILMCALKSTAFCHTQTPIVSYTYLRARSLLKINHFYTYLKTKEAKIKAKNKYKIKKKYHNIGIMRYENICKEKEQLILLLQLFSVVLRCADSADGLFENEASALNLAFVSQVGR